MAWRQDVKQAYRPTSSWRLAGIGASMGLPECSWRVGCTPHAIYPISSNDMPRHCCCSFSNALMATGRPRLLNLAVPVDCTANRTLSLRPEVVWCYNLDQPEYIAMYGDCESYYSQRPETASLADLPGRPPAVHVGGRPLRRGQPSQDPRSELRGRTHRPCRDPRRHRQLYRLILQARRRHRVHLLRRLRRRRHRHSSRRQPSRFPTARSSTAAPTSWRQITFATRWVTLALTSPALAPTITSLRRPHAAATGAVSFVTTAAAAPATSSYAQTRRPLRRRH